MRTRPSIGFQVIRMTAFMKDREIRVAQSIKYVYILEEWVDLNQVMSSPCTIRCTHLCDRLRENILSVFYQTRWTIFLLCSMRSIRRKIGACSSKQCKVVC